MYTRYFGFTEKPFTLTPNPRFIYLSKNHKEAFAHLLYGVNNHYGFIELVGEVGTGKTTVLRTLLDQLQDENYRSALIFNPCMTGVELLRSINSEFGISSSGTYINDLLSELNTFLLEENSRGKTVVLVIDEAQNLQPDVLEQVRLISNLETENDKLIQIILAGQPELETILEQPGLRQLNQRIAVKYKLSSMTFEETGIYIRHRMHVAGETGGVSFTPAAIRSIFLYTHGLPRLINILCDRALLIAYGNERRTISWSTVLGAVSELVSSRQKLKFAIYTVATGVMIIIAGLFLVAMTSGYSKSANHTSKITTPTAVVQNHHTSSSSPTRQVDLSTELIKQDRQQMQHAAINNILKLVNAKSVQVLDEDLADEGVLKTIIRKRKLHLTEFKGRVSDIARFDQPFILHSKCLGTSGDYHLAITPETSGKALITNMGKTGVHVLLDDLESISDGTFYLIWRTTKMNFNLKPGETGNHVKLLQRQLQQAGYYNGPVDGQYVTASILAVRTFQQKNNILQDDQVGELTMALLSKSDQQRSTQMQKGK